MDKRIGAVLIVVKEATFVDRMNHVLSAHAPVILSRQGLSLKDHHINVITLVVEGTTDDFGSLTGQLGRIDGLSVKSVMAKE